MFVVPLANDKIENRDGESFTVLSYTNFKSTGPAVYAQYEVSSQPILIYFFDITKINGVSVDFIRGSKVLNANGHIKRKIHIPQKHDTLIVVKKHTELVSDEHDRVIVQDLKLHNKMIGISMGMVVKGDDENAYRLEDIVDIKRAAGGDFFNRKKFLKIYSDYRGYIG